MAKTEHKYVRVESVDLHKKEVNLRSEDGFTGVARSVECFDNNGFRNFRILTLHISKGTVERIDRSDPYANFEAISRMELWNEIGMLNLNSNWKEGATLSK